MTPKSKNSIDKQWRAVFELFAPHSVIESLLREQKIHGMHPSKVGTHYVVDEVNIRRDSRPSLNLFCIHGALFLLVLWLKIGGVAILTANCGLFHRCFAMEI